MNLPNLKHDSPYYVFTLYISGMNANSTHAVANAKKLCEEYLHGRYELKVIDLTKDPEKIRMDQIVAVPTFVRELPSPVRKLIGNLSNIDKVKISLEIQ